jgi:4-amino-4-deoxy-L-arabinose transferase-like glycosyltransferase
MNGTSMLQRGGVLADRRSAAMGESTEHTYAPYERWHLVVLLGITLVGAVLRLYKLGEWAFWVDEAHTFRDVVAPTESFWNSTIGYYPLSYLLLRGGMEWFLSDTEGWLRLPFAFFGMMSVPALAIVGRNIVGRGGALIAAALLAVSPWHIYWSQNARAYSMVLFFVLMAAGAFYTAVVRRSWMLHVAALGMIALAGLCHPSAYIMFAAVLVFFLLNLGWRRWHTGASERWLPMIIVGLLVVLTAVLLPLVIHVQRVKSEFSLMHLAQTTVYFVRAPLLVAAVGGALLLFDRGERAAVLLTCWAVVPLLALGVLSVTLGVTAYYAFYTLPAVCLLAGEFIQVLAWRVTLGGFRGLLLRVVPLGILVLDMAGHDFLYFRKYHGERPRWREAFYDVLQRSGPKIRILTTNAPTMEYYRDRGAPLARLRGRDIEIVPITAWTATVEFIEEHVRGALAEPRNIYVIITEPELGEMDPRGTMESYLRGNLLQVQSYPNWTGPKDMTVQVFRP